MTIIAVSPGGARISDRRVHVCRLKKVKKLRKGDKTSHNSSTLWLVKSPLLSLYNEFIRYTDLVTNKAASQCLFRVAALALVLCSYEAVNQIEIDACNEFGRETEH